MIIMVHYILEMILRNAIYCFSSDILKLQCICIHYLIMNFSNIIRIQVQLKQI